ncbi:saccharopine dehydrogenase [Streptomyces sp. NPDC058637]|uniref:saccharopine dehydrogenase n=1 Tax=Streptomyces sp. NPDC058637 TaxID=3346569 RepID=UPI003647CC03
MTDAPQLWMRRETRPHERRAPITPEDARRLVAAGVPVTVEDCPQRVFPLSAYLAAGCRPAAPDAWTGAPRDAVVVGLKELPDGPDGLVHRHVMFGHAYKGQPGAARLLDRFAAGGGVLLDLEELTDDLGRRLAAFGYWAGYAGTALAVLCARGGITSPPVPTTRAALDASLERSPGDPELRALVLGALGRCGRGACDALTAAGLDPVRWDMAETRDLDRPALLAHDLLVNAVLSTVPATPFLTPRDLDTPHRRLTTVCDVTCDVGSECNMLPIYDAVTTWEQPVRRLLDTPPLDLIALDNLPSLLPEEASTDFSAALLPQLLALAHGRNDPASPWGRCAARFHTALLTDIDRTSERTGRE